MSELNEEIVGLLRETVAELSACRTAVHALIATHPDKDALRSALLAGMDVMADATPAHRIPLYRDSLQRYMHALGPGAAQQGLDEG